MGVVAYIDMSVRACTHARGCRYVGGFYVQSNYTSKGVQIDPKTGAVITTIIIETSQHTVPLLVPTLEIAAAQPLQAPSHNIFNKARQSLKQYTTLDHSVRT